MATNTNISFKRAIPLREEVDVFVAGGGPAGVAAAITAARQKRKVFLAEGQDCFGGMGTAGMVPAFMSFTDGVNFLAGGIGKEVYRRCFPDQPEIPRSSLGIRSEVLKRIYDNMVMASGVSFLFQTNLVGVEVENGRVTHAVCFGKSGIFAIRAKVFVDCTGDGDLAAWAGAPFKKGDEKGEMMPGTLCSLWADVDWKAVYKAQKNGQNGEKMLPKAFGDGIFTVKDSHLPGMWRVGTHMGGGNIGHTFGVDGTDERSLTMALIEGRKMLLEYERFYKEYMKGYEHMELVATGALLGLRETRRIIGDYVLGLEDFKKRAVFNDEIGRYCYPVDIHASRPGGKEQNIARKQFTSLRYEEGESYGIPYRCLIPEKLKNVLVAGRCISTDRYMLGSVRVMPGCFITGQAAGLAAAIIAEKKTTARGIDVKELQHRLKKIGAFLPNALAKERVRQ